MIVRPKALGSARPPDPTLLALACPPDLRLLGML